MIEHFADAFAQRTGILAVSLETMATRHQSNVAICEVELRFAAKEAAVRAKMVKRVRVAAIGLQTIAIVGAPFSVVAVFKR
ncbi:MAG: hypothetical protein H7Y08_10335 [Rhizobiaceae bacterium]|nr:hypothetical protein [Rhizobiaceae bacterium]